MQVMPIVLGVYLHSGGGASAGLAGSGGGDRAVAARPVATADAQALL